MSTFTLTPARKAILATINWAEGSPAYNQLFNYVPFDNNGPHPNQVVSAGGYNSTAAGAYQFLYSSWHDTIPLVPLSDYMSGPNQDQAALARINWRGALDEIDNGNIQEAIEILSYEWASLPPGRYGQPIKTMDAVLNYYNDALATFNGYSEASTVSPVQYNADLKKKGR